MGWIDIVVLSAAYTPTECVCFGGEQYTQSGASDNRCQLQDCRTSHRVGGQKLMMGSLQMCNLLNCLQYFNYDHMELPYLCGILLDKLMQCNYTHTSTYNQLALRITTHTPPHLMIN